MPVWGPNMMILHRNMTDACRLPGSHNGRCGKPVTAQGAGEATFTVPMPAMASRCYSSIPGGWAVAPAVKPFTSLRRSDA